MTVTAFINIGSFNWGVFNHPPRSVHNAVVFEDRFTPIKYKLLELSYGRGDIGYATLRTFNGERLTAQDETNWVFFDYAAIPLRVLKGNLDAPYVLGFFEDGVYPKALPEGLSEVYNPGNGVVLYKRNSP